MGRLLVVTLGLSMTGCGVIGSNPLAPASLPLPPTIFTYAPLVAGLGFYVQDVDVFQSSVQVNSTVRWNDGGKDLDLYWTNSSCQIEAGRLVGTGCQVLYQSTSSAGTSEQVSGPASAGATLRFFVINFANGSEPVTLTITLRR